MTRQAAPLPQPAAGQTSNPSFSWAFGIDIQPGTARSSSSRPPPRSESSPTRDQLFPFGVTHLTGRPVGKFDPEGLIFAVRLYSEPVELYDLRGFDKGPFNTFKLPQDKERCPSRASRDTPTTRGCPRRPPSARTRSSSSAGRRTAVCTCGARRRAWGGLWTAVLNCDHTDPVHCVQFNPKYMMLVAACWTIWATTWP
ncbi:hypothetical protein HPB47_013943 [Ixodes persulcatus]|uniref:Uncharacterized protein n=1 Tax=Ixodes persulcatus TaxID=34615 RepID=A0AC60QX71_IXOPE|nr:hypothetical protein HPB47_013943 [Ixodes persulcatus]